MPSRSTDRQLACPRRVPQAPLAAALWGVLLLLAAVPAAATTCAQWLAQPLATPFPGTNGTVYAMTSFDPDGAGPLGAQLIVAGDFSEVEGVDANNIAAWDGFRWRTLGTGTNQRVRALTVYNGQLIAGGEFTNAGGIAVLHIARWTGSAWLALGDGVGAEWSGLVRTLGVWGGELIVGGDFQSPGNNIARWNGAVWQGLGSGVDNSVHCLYTGAANLYIGGSFSEAGGVAAFWTAIWDGSSWSASPNWGNYQAPQSTVVSMTVYLGNLHAASVYGIHRLIGSDWSLISGALGPEGAAVMEYVAVHSGLLYATGTFNSPGKRVAVWNGSGWSPVGAGLGPSTHQATERVRTLAEYNGSLYAGGTFTVTGNNDPARYVARWNGSTWSVPDVPARVSALAAYGSKVAFGGHFSEPTPTGHAHSVLSWDGQTYEPLGDGLDAPAYALLGYSTGSPLPSHHLVVGGTFTRAGGLWANRVAQWTESPNFPFESWSVMGNGFNNGVLALELYRGQVVAGGLFTASGTAPMSRLGRWNGSSWQAMSGGVNGTVRALKYYYASLARNHVLVAGGDFTTANGATADRIAIWTENQLDGTVTPWQPLGDGFNCSVHAIERYNNSTYAAGTFTGSGVTPVNRIARHTANGWVPVGSSTVGGGFNGPVYALKVEGGYLYASGNFTSADGVPAYNVARWNGTSWSDASGGTIGAVYALQPFHGEVVAGGEITQAGAFSTVGAARLLTTGIPWLVSQPLPQSVGPGQSAQFPVVVADGYELLNYSWRRNAVPLSDGTTGHGSVIAGSSADLLLLQNVSEPDTGLYECVVSNPCGEVVSVAVPLEVLSATAVGDGPGVELSVAVWPNPARSTTRVAFQLPQEGVVSLSVFDVRGRKVRGLAQGLLPAGAHQMSWNGRDDANRALGPGVYLVRLTASGRHVHQRVLLLP